MLPINIVTRSRPLVRTMITKKDSSHSAVLSKFPNVLCKQHTCKHVSTYLKPIEYMKQAKFSLFNFLNRRTWNPIWCKTYIRKTQSKLKWTRLIWLKPYKSWLQVTDVDSFRLVCFLHLADHIFEYNPNQSKLNWHFFR